MHASERELGAVAPISFLPKSWREGVREMAKALDGRALLEVEMKDLLEQRGLGRLLLNYKSLLQWAWLQGWIELRSGITDRPKGEEEHMQRGWFAMLRRRFMGWRQSVVASCERCGSKGDKLESNSCASCGLLHCRTCTACINMGRCRACALLVVGVLTRRAELKLAMTREGMVEQIVTSKVVGSMSVVEEVALRSEFEDNAKGVVTNEDVSGQLGKWGLAPAQLAASEAALSYIAEMRLQSRKSWGNVHAGEGLQSARALVGEKELLVQEDAHAELRSGSTGIGRAAVLATKGSFLLWAVTGAGKTEMIFPLVEDALRHGGKVLIATPRRDVVLELKPRIQQAFSQHKVVTLYGGSPERWSEGHITLATTHQLMRFDGAFHLAIIDELDAFPYHNDPLLHRAAERACLPGGVFVYLSATPPEQMQREVKAGRLAHAKVPVRYHRHPLPVPQRIAMPSVSKSLKDGSLPSDMRKAIEASVQRGAQLFVFVARVRHVDGVVSMLARLMPHVRVEGTSAADEARSDKVTQFRERHIRILVTTTILERGVTVPKSDVFIWDADDRLFDTASLVQMAGRAGRSKDDPAGTVVFGSAQWSRAQRQAVRQIDSMNQIARRQGYLLPAQQGAGAA
ncbi:DEAD/DEAH box helicase family protein [Paenibacillus sp. 481]|nr:DEAD/DEAH box helicase family protein [Paenibacillus sp. 481]